MTIGFLFWLLMVLWILSGISRIWVGSNYPMVGHAWDLLLFVLLFLLGWAQFGFIIQT